ncbi:(S)-benzoin forming benzil reductase [Tenacibaculum sp. AHE15PA]|uniref:(S)-benzoin forming benzil reductase n=1 Tax=unclassified Tenacibaculum TaxID=2635139 RepID=UPI001C4FB6C6|nr:MULTISPECIES: (S)-benzoin forming benzil reductase [unclassified Tenacibaculum]QXP73895.1 (S)-benzoin forming benzil reductase [Tenacibaculum sp. AHE14PA]QXP75738.1 (S)-benzoin forming benzil reductase [Tenacibaculum sp. AHE15PA]
MDIIIITGGSKGIGKALANKYATENYKVYSLARTSSDLANVTNINIDLSNLTETENTFSALLKEIISTSVSSITLINNAGRLGKISNLENLKPIDISKTIQLNTTTPIILSSLFIKITKQLSCKKQIINISSGAAKSPYQGWSIYCTSKAAIDMMTKAIATEQIEVENGVKCNAIYPGVVDTNMQSEIRSTNKTDFNSLQRFVDLKENNELYTPEFVAETIYKVDTENQLKSGDIVDIRDF